MFRNLRILQQFNCGDVFCANTNVIRATGTKICWLTYVIAQMTHSTILDGSFYLNNTIDKAHTLLRS